MVLVGSVHSFSLGVPEHTRVRRSDKQLDLHEEGAASRWLLPGPGATHTHRASRNQSSGSPLSVRREREDSGGRV